VMGAVQQIGEIAVLVVGVIGARQGWLPVPWLS
jgi:2-keto-3-deoxy-galactonokinase